MPRAFLALRYTVPERRRIFRAGLEACGYEVIDGFPSRPERCDVFATWNRVGSADDMARHFPGRVLVAENAAWGNDFAGKKWYSIARDWHNTAGTFPVGSPDRWHSLAYRLHTWRTEGETVVLPQRGIGPPEVAMPRGWTAKGRVRRHPGKHGSGTTLEQDLANAGKVVTWGSGAAVKALLWGIKVESHYPRWVGAQDNTDEGRDRMFERLAWCQWELSEIEEGLPFRSLLGFVPDK